MQKKKRSKDVKQSMDKVHNSERKRIEELFRLHHEFQKKIEGLDKN